MKKEIEIKILNVSPEKLRANLKKLGGKRTMRPTLMREFYFSSPEKRRPFSSLRLRKEGIATFITLKLKKESERYLVRDEFEIKVDDFEKTKKILELMGFSVFRRREKIREEFVVGNIKIEIDTYPKMKPYAEIEGPDKRSVGSFLKSIGFPLTYTTKRTATEIIKDSGLNPDNLLFK